MIASNSGITASLLILCGVVAITAIAIKLFTFWFACLTSVMSTTEAQLPSKYDKILWVIIFLSIPMFAPFVYTASVEKFNAKKK